jgi:hypothetical protein
MSMVWGRISTAARYKGRVLKAQILRGTLQVMRLVHQHRPRPDQTRLCKPARTARPISTPGLFEESRIKVHGSRDTRPSASEANEGPFRDRSAAVSRLSAGSYLHLCAALFSFSFEDTAVQYIHTCGIPLRPGMSQVQRIKIDVGCLFLTCIILWFSYQSG